MPDSLSATEQSEIKPAMAADTTADETSVDGGADSAAESSPAAGAAPKSMLEAVQTALKPVEAPDTTKATESPTAVETGKDKPAETPKVDNYAEVPFNKHPRFRQLLKERNTFREQLTAKDTEIAKLKEGDAPQQETVKRFTAFTDAVKNANLNAKEVNDGFAIMSAMKRDPEEALALLTPYVQAMLTATGRTLDGDLKKKVEDGLVDTETASQLQRERHSRARLETQTQSQQTAFASAEQQRKTDDLVRSVTTAVSAWEERQKTDPDYQKKQPLVLREIGWLMQQEGYPQTPEAGVQMADKAKKTVEENLSKLMPQRQAVRTVTGGASAAQTAARPKTLLEAARLAARGEYQPA